MSPRITYSTACVLQALARGFRYGFDIMEFTALPSGTVYPILRRLEAHGLVTSSWEDGDGRSEARPRRRYYDLTDAGREQLELARAKLVPRKRIFDDLARGPGASDA